MIQTQPYPRQTIENWPHSKDLSGSRFGRLLVIALIFRGPVFQVWNCLCDCGNFSQVRKGNLTNKHTLSCGCLMREAKSSRIHGKSRTPIHNIWSTMLSRCYNPNSKSFPRYGGRGITVCEEWRNSFEAFWKDMGDRPAGLSIDRINNNLGYSKSNCRWATIFQQANNTRFNRFISFNGETKTISEWARTVGISESLLRWRLRRGWTIEKSLTRPVQ